MAPAVPSGLNTSVSETWYISFSTISELVPSDFVYRALGSIVGRRISWYPLDLRTREKEEITKLYASSWIGVRSRKPDIRCI
jgi:hypothetical protein